ncbi:hypothetical protein K438DRAFT_1784487 [Mycena galopus ATCC 62051]|nr:hypothetical protein K438DRAFT_1784487 [Mycena galopus ATCC 62051]
MGEHEDGDGASPRGDRAADSESGEGPRRRERGLPGRGVGEGLGDSDGVVDPPGVGIPSGEDSTTGDADRFAVKYDAPLPPSPSRPCSQPCSAADDLWREIISVLGWRPGTRLEWCKIGFNRVGTHKVVDMEDCPIATPIIRETLPEVRANVVHSFENNNSVLPSLVEYVREWIFAPFPDPSGSNANEGADAATPACAAGAGALTRPTHLLDAYCGAGFSQSRSALTSAPSRASSYRPSRSERRHEMRSQMRTLTLVSLGPENSTRPDPTPAARLQKSLFSPATPRTSSAPSPISFPPSQTVLLIDPPRKGCDEAFLEQLLRFGGAQDAGIILRGHTSGGKGKYVLESGRGLDLFPQTAHVERLVQDVA